MVNKDDLLYSREYYFFEPTLEEPHRLPVEEQMVRKLMALEEIGLRYTIERKSGYGTNTAIWDVKLYKK